MIKYGKIPPRLMESFGVAGLLGEDCHVFYSTLFNTKHVGRVSDLLCARLREAGVEEFQLRMAVLIKLFEVAFLLQDQFSEPVSVECGIDEEKVAIGISFVLPQSLDFKPETFVSSIGHDRNLGVLERFSAHLREACDRLVFRYEPATRRFETVVLVPLKDKIAMEDRAPFEAPVLVLVTGEKAKNTAKAGVYTELGDVDYEKLLEDEVAVAGAKTGDEPAPKRISSIAKAAVEKERVVKGSQKKKDDSVMKFSADPAEEKPVSAVITGGKTAEDEILTVKGEHEEEPEEEKTFLGKMFKKIWPFKKAQDDSEESEEDTEVEEIEIKAGEKPEEEEIIEIKAEEPQIPLEEVKFEVLSEASKDADKLIAQSESLENTVNKAQKESSDVKNDLENPKAKKWVDGLMQELLAEKAKINDMAKKLNLSLRQKELEFKNKERTMQQEVRQRDEMLKQKTTALSRAKEQLTQVQHNLENLKKGASTGASDEAYKQKYATAQKLLSSTKEENQVLSEKIENLKNQMVVLKAQKTTGSSSEAKETKAKLERSQKQIDEYRKLNQQLLDKIGEMGKKGSNAAGSEEMRKKMEQSAKLAATHQKEAETLKLKIEEMKSEKNLLKKELDQAKQAGKTAPKTAA